jgi:L-threonylcarbamoyladenylate synthase
MQTLIINTIDVLNKKGIILYPTDTIWGIGCDATNDDAIKKISEIKSRATSKSYIILVDSFKMLENYVTEIPEIVKIYLKNNQQPTTVIYENPKQLSKHVIANDDTVAIRIVKHGFCKDLITTFGKPIVSTSANTSKQPTPTSFSDIEKIILENVDFIVPLQSELDTKKTSSIVKVVNDEIKIIRA